MLGMESWEGGLMPTKEGPLPPLVHIASVSPLTAIWQLPSTHSMSGVELGGLAIVTQTSHILRLPGVCGLAPHFPTMVHLPPFPEPLSCP